MSTATNLEEREVLLKSLAGLPVDAPELPGKETGDSPPAGGVSEGGAAGQEPPPNPVDSGLSKEEGDSTASSKFRESRERAAKSWEEIKAERAKLEDERKAVEAERKRLGESLTKPPAAKGGYKPEQYETLAKQFEAEGRPDLAKLAGEEAARLRTEEIQAKATEAREGLAKAWTGHLNALMEKHPDLKDPQSEVHRRVDDLLKKRPMLFTYPEGIIDAVEAVKAHIAGARTGALEKEVAALKQQLAEKERLLQPAKGGPAVPSRAENFDELPLAQQRAALMREMQSTDAGV